MSNKLNNGGMWYCPMCDTQSLDKWVCNCPKHTPKMSIYDAVVKVEPAQTKRDSVGINDDPYNIVRNAGDDVAKAANNSIIGKEIWNAAIEAAAVEVNKYFLIEDVKEIVEQIRKLKK